MAKRILTVVGARPQFIKAAPVSDALCAAKIEETLVHTGQHFDPCMSDIFFGELGVPAPKHQLGINSIGHGAMTGRMLERIEEIIIAEAPELVLIYGDTNSTLAGALAAAKLHIPVAHVEAGLRSYNRRMPEEINRVLADHLSTILFCPSRTAVGNLKAEGIRRGVELVGDVMYDVTLTATRIAQARSQVLDQLGIAPKSYAVATLHRAENTDDPERLERLLAWLSHQAGAIPVVMPLHPRTKKIIANQGFSTGALQAIEPLGYLDMTWLVHNSTSVFTDSGGLQKEAYFHRVPCVTLREETEWVETIDAGWNRLWTVPQYRPRRDIDDYGSGNASTLIAASLARAA